MGLGGFPTGIPNGSVVINIKVAAAQIHRNIVIAVAGQTAEFGVFPEGITPGGVGAKPEEFVLADVIKPRQRRVGTGDYIFAFRVIEITIRIFPKVSLKISLLVKDFKITVGILNHLISPSI